MLKEDTIKREIRRLRKIIDERNKKVGRTDWLAHQAFGAEYALQWALGGCDWTPHGEVLREAEKLKP